MSLTTPPPLDVIESIVRDSTSVQRYFDVQRVLRYSEYIVRVQVDSDDHPRVEAVQQLDLLPRLGATKKVRLHRGKQRVRENSIFLLN